jgi:hypothetical protein
MENTINNKNKLNSIGYNYILSLRLLRTYSCLKGSEMENTLSCTTCKKIFSTIGNLERHQKRKTICYEKIECVLCFKVFNKLSSLKRHSNRKTPCEPIQGNPLEQTPENSCHFCYKKFSSKQCLIRHFNTCEIKNGGLALLFNKVSQLTKMNEEMMREIKTLKEDKHPTPNRTDNTMNAYINSPHNNTTFNFHMEGYDSDKHIDFFREALSRVLPGILNLPIREDVPQIIQVQDRIQQIMVACYRNPDHKEMQNVYVLNVQEKRENAFVYQEGNWKLCDWEKLSIELVQKIRLHASMIKTPGDILKVMKHIMILAGSDIPTVEKMTEKQIRDLYKDIGEKLKFDTIVL